MRLHDNQHFAGYRILKSIGRGGMGFVYLAEEPGVGRKVALKLLPEDVVGDAQAEARFQQEARTLAALEHAHIVPLYRYGIEAGAPWMALRYVEGGDLAARLRQPLSVAQGLALFRQIAKALDFAHRRGIVHRDLKPANVLVSRERPADLPPEPGVHGTTGDEEHVYLADFGIAKLRIGGLVRTGTGGILGTPQYMAPEFARGDAPSPATDIYALGVMAFQWQTGSLPFDADTPQAVLFKQVLEPLPEAALRALSPPVVAVLRQVLDKDPARRHRSAHAFVEALAAALNPASVAAPSPAPATVQVDPAQRFPAQPPPVPAAPTDSRAGLYGGIVAVLAVAGLVWLNRPAPSVEIDARPSNPPSIAAAACDTLAASPSDPRLPAGVHGVEFAQIDAPRAVAACRPVAGSSTNSRHWAQLGRALFANGDHAEAVDWTRKAAEAGDSLGMNNLGAMYAQGRGVNRDDAEAVRWYRRAADAGFINGMNNLGAMYAEGRGVTRDDAEAVRWYRKAAEAGDTGGMTNLGFMYAESRGVSRDDAEAVRWFRKAAEDGNARGMTFLGAMYADGRGVTRDDAEAVRWYRKAAEAGDTGGMTNLGFMYAEGRGVTRDDAEAVRWYRRAADAGFANGMDYLGFMYAAGRGVTRDDAEAVRWYRRAADAGNASGMNNLGAMYAAGRGVTRDDAEAVRWYRKAAEAGDTGGMTNLGFMYAESRGVSRDDAEAVRWFRKAAEDGNARGMTFLGAMYADGRGVTRDDAEAGRWYAKAATAGDAAGMYLLGVNHEQGRGVTRDVKEAVRWYRKAAEAGHENARKSLERLGES